ncbi:MAG TPA: hypothetical protein VNQ48_00210 [Microbacteriaceae bacterium]|nr:hypothetical protein [Microbacteriaceae bacterium]
MSSEPITDLRAWLREQLLEHVPAGWDITPGLPEKLGKLSRTTVYLEYTTFDPTDLPPGHVSAGVDLLVASRLEDMTKGENDVDDAVLDLVLALDQIIDTHPVLSWRGEPATKEQLGAGPNLCWRIKVAAIASLTRPTPTPDPVPGTPEE